MDTSVLLSIIIPVYNVEGYIDACLKSVINQTESNFEVIVVDDGSTDNSGKICDYYEKKYNQIRVIHTDNKGVSSARNTGLDNCNGEYVTFLDGDDTLSSDAVSLMLKYIRGNNVDFVSFNNIYSSDEIITPWKIPQGKYNKYQCISLLVNQNFPTSLWTSIYKRKLVNDSRLKEDIHHLEDLEYQFRMLCKSKNIFICNIPIYHYTRREGSANYSGVNKKLLSCLKVLSTIENEVRNDNKLPNRYIGLVEFRLYMTICAKYLMSKMQNKKMERAFVKIARKDLKDILKSDNLKMKIQGVMVAYGFHFYKFIYKFKHRKDR